MTKIQNHATITGKTVKDEHSGRYQFLHSLHQLSSVVRKRFQIIQFVNHLTLHI